MPRDLMSGPLTDAERSAIDGLERSVTIERVEEKFAAIPEVGERLAAHDAQGFPSAHRYTARPENADGNENHFQGIQRLRSGNHIAISGGDWREPMSHVFVFAMGSCSAEGCWGSNLADEDDEPAEADTMVGTIGVDRELWHAGGMDTWGDLLAVPVEYGALSFFERLAARARGLDLPKFGKRDRSSIVFYYTADPERPKLLETRIDRLGRKATAVALTRLANRHYLCAVESAHRKEGQRIDFYLSRTHRIWEGFRAPTTWTTDLGRFDNYQAINFVRQADDTLYLIGLHNTSDTSPTVPGDDRADLYRVTLDDADRPPPDDAVGAGVPRIEFLSGRSFRSDPDYGNMDAGGGVFVERDRLIVYSAYHWRTPDGLVRFSEFGVRAPVVVQPPRGDPSIRIIE